MTKYEKYILVFLVFTGLLGTGLLHYKKTSSEEILELPSEVKHSRIININTATEEELTILKGIGPALASRIVAHREENGYFSSKEGLKKVKGIGPRKFEGIKESIAVE